MPRKNRRNITVNNILYHYVVNGRFHVRIENAETGEAIEWGMEQSRCHIKYSPGFIKHLIETEGNPIYAMDHFYWESLKSNNLNQ